MVISFSLFAQEQQQGINKEILEKIDFLNQKDPDFMKKLSSFLALEEKKLLQPKIEPKKEFQWTDIFETVALKKKKETEKFWSFLLGFRLRFHETMTENQNNYQTWIKTLVYGGQATVGFDDNFFSFIFDNTVSYGKTKQTDSAGLEKKIVSENKGKSSLNIDFYLLDWLKIFGFTTHEYNHVLQLTYRQNSGAGLKFVFFRNPYLVFDTSFAPIYQYEYYQPQNKPEIRETTIRISNRVRLNFKLKGIVLENQLYYIAFYKEWEKYRIEIENIVKLPVYQWVSFSLRHTYVYNTDTPIHIRRKTQTLLGQINLEY